jgi:hypothetical protein
MRLSELKEILTVVRELNFELPDGTLIPKHFHVTEVGQVNKTFVDCGAVVRQEKAAVLQLWEAGDTGHRLVPEKLNKIINLSERILGMEDSEIEVEYQDGTIGKYGLDFNGKNFLLTVKRTACLAGDQCSKPANEQKINPAGLRAGSVTCCSTNSGCR